jgi:outer membrane protein OmpA-like peptidoglycan-associated protein
VKRIDVEGHTDDVGRNAANNKLGEQRGKAIQEYLQGQGIPPALFKLKSFGETKPKDSNRTDAGRARNRRATVTLIK